ncbi:hypothetical protein MTP99_018665 [Tenebrio molitor]|nr:hypothetical protein MTP99_018665 [Tenebrio molitor]
MAHYVVAVAAWLLLFQRVSAQDRLLLVNLNSHCFRCLCHAASRCNLTVGCDGGYCGPYKISKIYWKDAGEVILPDDEKGRAGGRTPPPIFGVFLGRLHCSSLRLPMLSYSQGLGLKKIPEKSSNQEEVAAGCDPVTSRTRGERAKLLTT